MYDITIIGAGVIGCSIARELSKYKIKVCVVEKEEDVSEETTKANSGIIHGGYDAKPGTLKASLNAKGNAMFDKLSHQLDFPFKRNGSLVVAFKNEDIKNLEKLKERGIKNEVPNLKILSKEEVKKLEPNISNEVVAALNVPTGGIVNPYEMTIALAENAYVNGVEFKFNTLVIKIEKIEDRFIIKTNNQEIQTKIIINAAGVFADDLNNMVSEEKIHITPRKGEYCLFDKAVGNKVNKTLFQVPGKMGKGILVTPTVDGNLLIGPNAIDVDDKLDLTTTREGIDDILKKAKIIIGKISTNKIITSFAGLRAHSDKMDFIIGETPDVKNFINVAGIESPGLSSAPAIAKMVEDIIIRKISPEKNNKFNPIRKGITKFRDMNIEERKKIIAANSSYGKIICRCETVTEGEIIEAIRRPLGAKSLDAIKRRTRAGMGRCQSGFCLTKIVDILAKELNIPKTEVTKFGGHSQLLVGKNKEL